MPHRGEAAGPQTPRPPGHGAFRMAAHLQFGQVPEDAPTDATRRDATQSRGRGARCAVAPVDEMSGNYRRCWNVWKSERSQNNEELVLRGGL